MISSLRKIVYCKKCKVVMNDRTREAEETKRRDSARRSKKAATTSSLVDFSAARYGWSVVY